MANLNTFSSSFISVCFSLVRLVSFVPAARGRTDASAAAITVTDAVLGRQVAEYCEGESFVAVCPDGFAVLITRAVYGRMRRGRCVVARQDVGCSTDVMAQLDWRCSGRPSCRLPVTDLLQSGTKPCPMDYRSYLEASYECIPVQTVGDGTCNIRLPRPSISSSSSFAAAVAAGATTHDSAVMTTTASSTNVTPPQSGYVTSYVTSRSGCGSVDRPWPLRADPGQRIRLTLFDFSSLPPPSSTSGGSQDHHLSAQQQQQQQSSGTVCMVYAVIREPTVGGQTRTVCGGRAARDELVMISSGHMIDLRLVGKKLNSKDRTQRPEVGDDQGDGGLSIENFMIGFQFLGCPNPILPSGAWLKRTGDKAEGGCGASLLWQLTCVGDDVNGYQWNNQPDVTMACDNEAIHTSLSAADGRQARSVFSLFKGMSVVILAAVALIVGLLVLSVGLVYISRRRQLAARQALCTTQFNSLGDATNRQTLHHSIYPPPPPPNKECRQLLLHCDIGQRSGNSRYIGGTSDVCRPTSESSSMHWQLVDRGDLATGNGRMFPCASEVYSATEHVYESPSFERKTTFGALSSTTGDGSGGCDGDVTPYGTGSRPPMDGKHFSDVCSGGAV